MIIRDNDDGLHFQNITDSNKQSIRFRNHLTYICIY